MKRILTLSIVHIALCTTLLAVPARRGIRNVNQPNGDTLRVELIGDEVWHAYYTEDGYQITQGEDGWWRYSQYTGKTYTDRRGNERRQTKAARRKVHNADQRCACERRWLKRKGIYRG